MNSSHPRARRINPIERLALRLALLSGDDPIGLARSLGISPTGARLATAGLAGTVDINPNQPPAAAELRDHARLRTLTFIELGVPASMTIAVQEQLWNSLVATALALLVEHMAKLEGEIGASLDEMRAAGADPSAYEQEMATRATAGDLRQLVDIVANPAAAGVQNLQMATAHV